MDSTKQQQPQQLEDPQWVKALKKSIINNRQLQFTNISSIAYLYNGEAGIDNITFDQLEKNQNINNKLEEYSLLYTIDKRKSTFNEMKHNSTVSITWYFPLTKEQYKMKCHFSYISLENNNNLSNTDDDSILLQSLPSDQQILLDNSWKRIDKEAKKLYHEPHPDTYKPTTSNLTDLERFNCPEKTKISPNFALLVLTPFRMEHTCFAMPQVVADGRNEFESIFKPYKKHQKYLHHIENDQWKVSNLNP